MTTRVYNQFCALASALDYVGERWTLLIIREMLIGPRRFTDLMNGMPGISSSLLADRLKVLEQQGLLQQRVLPVPAGSTVYELTPLGRSLEAPIIELGRWGAQFLPPSLDEASLPSLGSIAVAIKAFFHPEQARPDTFGLNLDKQDLQIHIRREQIEVQQGQAQNPRAVFTTSMPVFLGLFTGRLEPARAVADGLVQVQGDPNGLERFLRASSVPAPQ